MSVRDSRRYLLLGIAIALTLPLAWWLFPRPPFAVGQDLASRGREDEALAVWEKACGRGEPDIDCCAAAAVVRLGRGEKDEARALVERARSADASHLRVLLMDSRLLEGEGKPAEAKAVLEEAERLHPDSGLPPANLARLALASNDVPEAERCAERALAADPRLGLGHALKARALALAGEREQAVDAYVSALELDNLRVEWWLELAGVLEALGQARWSERLQVLQEAVRIAPRDPHVLLQLGRAQRDLGMVDAAVESLRSACDLDPASARCRVVLGVTFLEQGKPGFALPRLTEALELEPDDVDAAHYLAEARATLGETDAALDGTAKLLAREDLPPGARTRALFFRATTHDREGRFPEALEDVARILEIEPKHEGANWLCGRIANDAGDTAKAEECLMRVAPGADGPPNVSVIGELARLAARKGRVTEAVAYLGAMQSMGALDPRWVNANPEFRALEDDESFRLLMEGATQQAEPALPGALP